MTLLQVVDPATVILALVAGVAGGVVLALLHPLVASRRSAVLMGVFTALLGAFFYAGRIGYGLAQADPITERVISSFVLWLVFSAGTGVGTYLHGRTK